MSADPKTMSINTAKIIVKPKTTTSGRLLTADKCYPNGDGVHMTSVKRGPLVNSSLKEAVEKIRLRQPKSIKKVDAKTSALKEVPKKDAELEIGRQKVGSLKEAVEKIRSRQPETVTKVDAKTSALKEVSKKADAELEIQKVDSLAITSQISSVGFIPSALEDRAEVQAKRQTIHRLKEIAKHLDVSLMIFGFSFVLLGLFDVLAPEPIVLMQRHYFLSFGAISLIPLLSSPIAYFALHCHSSCLLVTSIVANFLFLLGGISFFVVYLTALQTPSNLTDETLFLVLASLSLAQSVALFVVHCSILRTMGVIRVVPKKAKILDGGQVDTESNSKKSTTTAAGSNKTNMDKKK